MTWYWYVAIYVVGHLFWWRAEYSRFIKYRLEELEVKNRKIRESNSLYAVGNYNRIAERTIDDDEKTGGAVVAALLALIWPVLLVAVPTIALVMRPTRAEKKLSRTKTDRKELEVLRKQAQELGLPFPEQTKELN